MTNQRSTPNESSTEAVVDGVKAHDTLRLGETFCKTPKQAAAWERLPSETMPDDDSQLAGWLEDQLTGDHLADLARELTVWGVTETDGQSLEEVLHHQTAAVLEQGLTILAPHQVRQLMLRPRLLFELQERICISGGKHWTHSSGGNTSESGPSLGQLEQLMERVTHVAYIPGESQPVAQTAKVASRGSAWTMLLTAACGIASALGVGFWLQPPEGNNVAQIPGHSPAVAATWGWQPIARFESITESNECLESLAAAAEEWRQTRPGNESELTQRVESLIAGCEALIAANLPALSPDQQTTLRQKCTKWLESYRSQLANLQSGETTWQDTLQAFDELSDKAAAAIRNLKA